MNEFGIRVMLSKLLFPRLTQKGLFNEHAYEFMRETFFKEDYKFLLKDIKKDTIAIDLGANIGDSSIYLAKDDRIKKVYAYEPLSYFYDEAINNIALASLNQKIELSKTFIVNDYADQIDIHPRYLYEGHNNTKIEKITFKSILNEVRHKHPNSDIVLKCDIEGGEYNIFKEDVDYSNVKRIALELHESNSDDLLSVLRNKGYQLNEITTKGLIDKKRITLLYGNKIN